MRSCPIQVITRVMGTDIVESDKIIDHYDSSDRKWLDNHTRWAMFNGRTVTILSIVSPARCNPE